MTEINSEIRTYQPEPLSIGEIIDRTLQIYKEYWAEFLIPAVIYALPMTIIFAFSFYLGFTGKKITDPEILAFNAVSSFVGWFLFMILSAVVIEMTGAVVENRPVSYKKALKGFFPVLIPYAVTTLLNGAVIAAVLGISILPVLPMVMSFSFSSAYSLIVLPVLALIILTVDMYLISMFLLVSNVSIIEGKFYLAGLARSVELFNADWESRWKVLTIPALIQGLVVIFSILIPFLGYTVTLLLTPLSIISLTLVYYDIRFRCEGLDLELKAKEQRGSETSDPVI